MPLIDFFPNFGYFRLLTHTHTTNMLMKYHAVLLEIRFVCANNHKAMDLKSSNMGSGARRNVVNLCVSHLSWPQPVYKWSLIYCILYIYIEIVSKKNILLQDKQKIHGLTLGKICNVVSPLEHLDSSFPKKSNIVLRKKTSYRSHQWMTCEKQLRKICIHVSTINVYSINIL